MIEFRHVEGTRVLGLRRRETARTKAICLSFYVGDVTGITFGAYRENPADWRRAIDGSTTGFAFIRLLGEFIKWRA